MKTKELTLPKPSKDIIRKGIMSIEDKIASMPNAQFGDEVGELKHSFGEGLYIRELKVPKNMLISTKIHKRAHPYFLLQGECSILTDEGVIKIKAPYYGITKAGTKRIVYTHDEVLWVTVHATDKKDLLEIEDEIIAKTFDECFPTNEELLKLTEEKI
ncbi:Phage protein [Azospirillaceae bacterium]